jgi:hypothetical protein
MTTFTLKAQGIEATAGVPSWQDLLTWEREKEEPTKGGFVAMRRLWQRVRTSGGEGMKPGAEVSLMVTVLERCGNGAVVREMAEDEFSKELADAWLKYQASVANSTQPVELHALEAFGLQFLVRDPRGAELEHYSKAREKSELSASLAMAKSCTLWCAGAPEKEPLAPFLERYPAIMPTIAAALSNFGGMSFTVEVGES